MEHVLNPGGVWRRSNRKLMSLSVPTESLLRGPHPSFAVGGAEGRAHENVKGKEAAAMQQTQMNSTVAIIAVVALAFVIFRSK